MSVENYPDALNNVTAGCDMDSSDDATEEMQFKGALKVTKIKNRKYIRMPNFPKRAVVVLKNWLYDHMENPYPTDKEKVQLSKDSGLSKRQIQNWFTNARKVHSYIHLLCLCRGYGNLL
jgi:hypothetical protein